VKEGGYKEPKREVPKDAKSCFEEHKSKPKEESSSEGNGEAPLEIGPSKKDPSKFFGGGQHKEYSSSSKSDCSRQSKEWLIKKPQDKLQKKSEACCEESEEKSHSVLLKCS
jgi:hypothetical protein